MSKLTGSERQQLHNVYTSFSTGVTVVGTIDAAGRSWGMTASSFYSLSLDPPLISIALTRNTPSHTAFVKSDEFAVSILTVEQVALARKFATSSDDKFEGVELEKTPFTAPVLAGAAAWLVCTPTRVLEVGDHTLLVASVRGTHVHDRSPLVYNRGSFYGLADRIQSTPADPKLQPVATDSLVHSG